MKTLESSGTTRIEGIPCWVRVSFDGNSSASNPQFQIEVFDRKGRRAPWLERKLTPEIKNRIVSEHFDPIFEE